RARVVLRPDLAGVVAAEVEELIAGVHADADGAVFHDVALDGLDAGRGLGSIGIHQVHAAPAGGGEDRAHRLIAVAFVGGVGAAGTGASDRAGGVDELQRRLDAGAVAIREAEGVRTAVQDVLFGRVGLVPGLE